MLELYEQKLEVRAKSKTVAGTRSASRTLLRILRNVDVRDLSEADIDRFIIARRVEGVKDKTINGQLVYLRAALRHARTVGSSSTPFPR